MPLSFSPGRLKMRKLIPPFRPKVHSFKPLRPSKKAMLCVRNNFCEDYLYLPHREEFETAYKHVIVEVTGREGRTVLAGNLQFSLDSVKIDFIPVEGGLNLNVLGSY